MSEVIFEPLPPDGRGGGWMDELRARPGEWARVPVNMRTNRRFYEARGFEVASRTVDGVSRSYARYVGLNGEHA